MEPADPQFPGTPSDLPAPQAIGQCAHHPSQPAIAPCDRCGLFICVNCAERQDDGRILCTPCVDKTVGGVRLPWRGLQAEGWQRAWWGTVQEISFRPDRALRGVGEGDVRTAVTFGLLSQCIGYVLYLPFQFGEALLDPTLGQAERPIMLKLFAGLLLTLPLWVFVGMVSSAAFMHPFLRMVGGAGDFNATLRAMAYSSAPQTFYAIPCVGPLVGGALAIVSFVYGQKHAHGIPGSRVLLAWLLLVLATLLLVLVGMGLLAVVAGR